MELIINSHSLIGVGTHQTITTNILLASSSIRCLFVATKLSLASAVVEYLIIAIAHCWFKGVTVYVAVGNGSLVGTTSSID
jgi:hypothetical protein